MGSVHSASGASTAAVTTGKDRAHKAGGDGAAHGELAGPSSASGTAGAPTRKRRTEAERRGAVRFQSSGLNNNPLGDLYHTLLTTSWPRFFALIIALYVALNALFALGYLAMGDGGVEHMRPGSFTDAFFFSVQTMATIGYGTMSPHSVTANALVTIEALTGMMGVAMATGLMFAKFARPTARVMFSDVAVIAPRDGVRSFMVRMANARASRIIEATVRMVLLRAETTREGEQVRRFHDLTLTRGQSSMFAMSWTVIHPIDEKSPLYGVTPEQLRASSAQIVVSLVGMDETFGQTVHARYTYAADEIVCDARFVDVMKPQPDGTLALDYSRFHDIEPVG